MNTPEPSPEFWSSPVAYVVLVVSVIAVLTMVVKMRRPAKINATLTAMAEEREREMGGTRCPCGETATDPAPVIRRSRGGLDWLRNYFGVPPRWTREIDHMRPPVFCRSHAHVADEMVNQALLDLRAQYAGMNVTSATIIAGFEQEHLLAKVQASLTDKQKKAQRSAAPGPLRSVSSIVRTGTDDES
jgi:hypothetical protein